MTQSLDFTTESTGNGNLILVENPGSNLQTGDTFTAFINTESEEEDELSDEWEYSNCTYITAGRVTRDSVVSSGANNGTDYIAFSSGIKTVSVQLPVEKEIRNSTNVNITNNAIAVTTVNATTVNAPTVNTTTANVNGVGVYSGTGAPSLSAAKGSLYLRKDGSGVSDRAYINTNGSTSWTALTTAA